MDVFKEMEKLHQSFLFQKIIERANYPVIPVHIQKGIKPPCCKLLQCLLKKYRVPASLSFGALVYKGQESLLSTRHEHELCFED
jgi:acyl-[acyl-carrier-protein]-phospholipid O-acyltransferase/long-chain-fatty-acid--[acyl-carrier-protein] ligase